jgi:hypothetical protein
MAAWHKAGERSSIMRTSTLAFILALSASPAARAAELFLTSDNCIACHNGMSTPSGRDVSIGTEWRATMMANSARDPYWQASVRRELREHAPAGAAIENECSLCHMPMGNLQTRSEGGSAKVFGNLTRGSHDPRAALAQDGVSCALCHQIQPDKLGKPESFIGGFVVDLAAQSPRKLFGPFEVKPPLARLMASATRFLPAAAEHIRSSELCATCHTLITDALDADGRVVGRLPEQVPYLEWLESAYREGASCASCHMPEVREPAPIASLLSEPRRGLLRHEFVGGNFIVPALLKRLGVAMPALSQDLDRASGGARAHLAESAAKLGVEDLQLKDEILTAQIKVENGAGHKLPTAYPSRRAWLHITVKDGKDAAVFESGAVAASGKIAGNDNDDDPSRFEQHHRVIEKPDQVQIYEPILADKEGRVTTGLLHAVKYLKDNRIAPIGFDKKKAAADVAVHGEALADDDFTDGSDQVSLRVPVGGHPGPYKVEVELLYQPIGYRWAENLRTGDAPESRAFSRAFDALAAVSYQRMARAEGRAGD